MNLGSVAQYRSAGTLWVINIRDSSSSSPPPPQFTNLLISDFIIYDKSIRPASQTAKCQAFIDSSLISYHIIIKKFDKCVLMDIIRNIQILFDSCVENIILLCLNFKPVTLK